MSGMKDGEWPPEAGDDASPEPLPRDIQEHLGRQLRSAYNAQAERPAFLGDPAVPPHFERLIRRIEVGEKTHELGVEAVRQALELDDDPEDGGTDDPRPLRR